ncbi:hypothetical protein [Streptomyces macrosporus]
MVLATLVCLGATGLTACGDDADDPFEGKSADTIAEEAMKATRDASSVRMKGTARPEGTSVKVDFHVDEQGDCRGTLSARGARADVVKSGRTTYVRGDEKFWSGTFGNHPDGRRIAEELRDRWVKSDTGDTGVRGMCDKREFLAALDGDASERAGMEKSGTTEVEGKEALALKRERPGGERLTLYVATEGEPYILKAVSQGGEAPSEVVLTDYDEKVHAEKPPADRIVDAESIGR